MKETDKEKIDSNKSVKKPYLGTERKMVKPKSPVNYPIPPADANNPLNTDTNKKNEISPDLLSSPPMRSTHKPDQDPSVSNRDLTSEENNENNNYPDNSPANSTTHAIRKARSELKPIGQLKSKNRDERLTAEKIKEIKTKLKPVPNKKQQGSKSVSEFSSVIQQRRDEIFSVFENRDQVINLEETEILTCEICLFAKKSPTHCFTFMQNREGEYICNKCGEVKPLEIHCGHPMQQITSKGTFHQFLYLARQIKNQGKFDHAIEMYKSTLNLLNDLDETEENLLYIALCKMELGLCYNRLGRFRESKFHLLDAQEIYETLVHIEGMAKSAYYLGSHYLDNGQLDYAKQNFDLAKDLISEIDEQDSKAKIHIASGILHRVKGDYEEAILEFQNALSLSDLDDIIISDIELNLGVTSKYSGDFTKTIDHLKKALSLTPDDDIFLLTKIYFQLISVGLIVEEANLVSKYMDDLRMIYLDHKDDNYVVIRYKIAKALQQKYSNRLIPKAQALIEFKNILDQNLYEDFEQQIFVMINVMDLLLQELQAFEDETVLVELQSLMKRISRIAKEQDSKSLFFQSSLIQIKLHNIQDNYTESVILLEELKEFTKKEDLPLEHEQVKSLEHQLSDEMNRIERLSKSQQSIREKLSQSKIKQYIQNAMKMVDID